MGKKYRKKQGKRSSGTMLFLLFIGVFSLTIFALYTFERKMLPSLQEISHMQTRALANTIIDQSLTKTMETFPMTSGDFLSPTQPSGYSANTQAINSFCMALNEHLNQSMKTLPEERILIPIGAAANLNFFANMGPKVPFTLMPAGAVSSDYETAFVSAGINQLNYKIWLNIALDVQIVNPLYREKITLTRKVMLVDTIIEGKVPNQYLSLGEKGNNP